MSGSRILVFCLLFYLFNSCLQAKEEKELTTLKSLSQDFRASDLIMLDLESVLLISLQKNLALQIAEYDLKSKQYQLWKSGSKFLPNLSLISAFTKTKGNLQFTGDELLPRENESYTGGANFSFDLFQGGKVLFGWIAEQKSFQAAKKTFDTQEQELLAKSSLAYFRLQAYLAQLQSELIRIEKAQANLSKRKAALEIGTEIRLNVLLAEEELALARASFAKLKSKFYAESVSLTNTLNLSPGTVLVPQSIDEKSLFLQFEQKFTRARANKLLELALEHNPEISKEKLNYQALQNQKKVALGDFLPRLTARANLGYIGPRAERIKENNQYTLSASYDLASLGAEKITNLLEANNQGKRARKQLNQRIAEISSQTLIFFFDLIAEQEVYLANKKALQVSLAAYEYAQARQEAGLATPYELKSAQSSLETTRSRYYDAWIALRTAQVSLLKAVGLINIKNFSKGFELKL